jgi:hypothetical protein
MSPSEQDAERARESAGPCLYADPDCITWGAQLPCAPCEETERTATALAEQRERHEDAVNDLVEQSQRDQAVKFTRANVIAAIRKGTA